MQGALMFKCQNHGNIAQDAYAFNSVARLVQVLNVNYPKLAFI